MQQLELWIGKVLFASIVIAFLILVVSGSVYLVHHGGEPMHKHIFLSEPQRYTNLRQIIVAVSSGDLRSILMLGLLLVLLGQILRVFLTGIIFAIQQDGVFFAISAVIFIILVYNAL